MKSSNLWVVIPAKDERKRIAGVLGRVKKFTSNVVVVDDGSNDDTYEMVKSKGIFVLRHLINLGKGAALKTGCDFAIKKGANILIVIDADGQHEPEEIPNFLNALEGNEIVFGYRAFNVSMPFILRFGNSFINLTTKLLYGVSLKDTQCGYRAFTADAYRKIRWNSSDYSMESEMIANTGKKHLKYKEMPIKTIYLDKYKGTTILNGIKIVMNMFLWKFKK